MRSALEMSLGALAGLALLAGPVTAASAASNQWPAETITGKISLIQPALKTVVVDYSGNVPMDLIVTPTTHIDVNGRTVALKDLQQYMNDQASVRFVPEGRGDVAQTIHITG